MRVFLLAAVGLAAVGTPLLWLRPWAPSEVEDRAGLYPSPEVSVRAQQIGAATTRWTPPKQSFRTAEDRWGRRSKRKRRARRSRRLSREIQSRLAAADQRAWRQAADILGAER